MLNVVTRVAKSIWTGLIKMKRTFTEAQMARAEWEVQRHIKLYGYDNLSEFQKQKLKYYGRSNF